MDEPLSALDRNLREEMQFELKALHTMLGSTILYVTHDQQEAVTMSDRVAVMQAGRIVQLAAPREIYERPSNAFVAGFIGETNLIDCVVRGRSGSGYAVDIGGQTLRVEDGEALPPGSLALVAVRPETIRLEPAAAAEPGESCVVTARVEQALFLGESVRYIVDTGTLRLVAKEQTDPARPVFGVGDSVGLKLHPSAMRLLARPG